MSATDALMNSELFFDLSNSEVDALLDIVTMREIEPGEVLIREGDQAYSLFIIEEGSVDVLKDGQSGLSSRIAALSDGALFGEMAFFDRKRSAGVVARTRVKVMELPYSKLEELTQSNAKLGAKLYRALAMSLDRKLKNTTDFVLPLVASTRRSALNEITAHVAHAIGGPLSVLQLLSKKFTELLNKPAASREEVTLTAEEMEEAADRISRVISNLRSLSENDPNDVLEEFDPSEVIRRAYEICEQRLQSNSIRMDLRIPDPCPRVMGKPVHLSQALLNLISNSIDALLEKPLGSSPWIQVAVKLEGDRVSIEVTDSGRGIPDKTAQHVFKPFYSTRTAESRSGLGLSISRQVIERDGGSLELDRDHTNTRFVIRMPLANTTNQ